MGRFLTLILAALVVSSTGCMFGKPLQQVESLNKTLKEAIPASVVTPQALHKTPPATQFAAAWQTKLGQLPDPTKNGIMNRGIVGQAFLYTDTLTPAEITGSLTIVVNDSTDRTDGQPPRQPNIWHFDAETLKRMVVNDDRFGKSVALFLPWPEEWVDVNRLYIQARYDQPNSYTVYAPPASVTLDLFSTGQFQTSHSQGRVPANQLSVPDPKLLIQNSVPRSESPIMTLAKNPEVNPQVNPAVWPSNIVPPGVNSPAMAPAQVGQPQQLPPGIQQPQASAAESREFQRTVIQRK